MKHILHFPWQYFNPKDPEMDQFKGYYYFESKFWTGTTYITHSRYGPDYDTLLFTNDDIFIPCPELGYSVGSFADVTDLRSLEILKLAQLTDKQVIIFWSGGTDSTVILSSILKNWPVTELDRVIIALNSFSCFENPTFFKNFIVKNFKYQLVTDEILLDSSLFSKYIVVDGDPADKLWIAQAGLSFAEIYGRKAFSTHWKSNLDNIKNFCLYKVADMSEKDINKVIDRYVFNIESMNGIIETTGQLFSWISFNFHYSGHCWHRYAYAINNRSENTFKDFKTNFKPWFNSAEYQQWAWSDDAKESKIISSVVEYKMPAKKYIHELTKNDFDLVKIKIPSSRISANRQRKRSIIYDDGTCIELDKTNYKTIFQNSIVNSLKYSNK